MVNKWQEIWNKRQVNGETLSSTNPLKVYQELKMIDGYDLSKITLQSFVKQHEIIKNNITKYFDKKNENLKSVYEIGCGAGANLYMFEQEGIIVGGGDYSKTLVDVAKKVIKSKDIKYCEAVNIDVQPTYEAVLSNGVFEYFPDLNYARNVLEIAYKKATKVIALVDVYNADKEEDFYNFRRKNVKDFDKLYKDLPKLFYPEEFFINFAKEHNMKLEFKKSTLEGYWNNDFIYSCYMYK